MRQAAVAQAFLPAGWRDIPVPPRSETGGWKAARIGRLESLPYIRPPPSR